MDSVCATMSACLIPKGGESVAPNSAGPIWRVTNKGECESGKANDRVKAKDHLPTRGFPVVVQRMGSVRVPSLLSKRPER